MAEELQWQMSASQGQYTLAYTGKVEGMLMKTQTGRLWMTVMRPWLHHLYNVSSQVKKAMLGDLNVTLAGGSKAKAHLQPIAKLMTTTLGAMAIGGTGGVIVLGDILKEGDKLLTKLKDMALGNDEEATLVEERFFDWATSKVRDGLKWTGASDKAIDNALLAMQGGMLAPLGVHLGMNESMRGLTQPFMFNKLESDIKRIAQADGSPELYTALMKVFIPTTVQRKADAFTQLGTGKYMDKVTWFGDWEKNKLRDRDFNAWDLVRYSIQGQNPKDRAAREAAFFGSGITTTQGKRNYMKKMLKAASDEMTGFTKDQDDIKETFINTLLDNDAIANNAPAFKKRLIEVYKTDKYKNAINVSLDKLEEFVDNNWDLITKAVAGTDKSLESVSNDERDNFIGSLSTVVKSFYQSQAVDEVLNEMVPKLTNGKIKFKDKKPTKVFDYSDNLEKQIPRKVRLYDKPFEEQGFYKAWQPVVNKVRGKAKTTLR